MTADCKHRYKKIEGKTISTKCDICGEVNKNLGAMYFEDGYWYESIPQEGTYEEGYKKCMEHMKKEIIKLEKSWKTTYNKKKRGATYEVQNEVQKILTEYNRGFNDGHAVGYREHARDLEKRETKKKQESPSEDNLVEKIIDSMWMRSISKTDKIYLTKKEAREILKKHLLPK